ncbi:hypothetical protein JAAARDRAFT_199159 [Jaapia argillacea MUCL 33604]|uniref:Uncharacterized protein n=1 Tax=Jaapia argillacea MUCL 33604 TaxID=933084 RepID=A0A067P8T4_9AGAM|nr:hypothetical protein JAAARDRAFT_199159 [Jaapia argillacea MUCL 33604]
MLQRESQLDLLRQNIAEYCRKLAEWEAQEETQATQVLVERSLLAPIRKLPPEVLARIFILCLPDAEYVPVDITTMPLLTSRICYHWREVALHTPVLWSSMALSIPSSPSLRQSLSFPNILRLWMTRSEPYPVSIRIGRTSGYSSNFILTAMHVVEVAAQYSHRWKRISLQLPSFCLSPLTQIHKSDTPILENLSLNNTAPDPTHHLATLTFLTSPSHLRELSLSNLPQTVWDIGDSFPSTQLTKLHILRGTGARCWSAYEWLKILTLVPNITECIAHIDNFPDRDPSQRPPRPIGTLELPHLCSLTLNIRGSNVLEHFLGGLVLPQLSYLEITGEDPWPQSPLQSLINRSSCSLRTAIFHAGLYDPQLFVLMPSLSRLSLSTHPSFGWLGIQPNLVPALTISPFKMPIRLPQLEELSLSGDLQFSKESLCRLIRSRWGFEPGELSCLKTIVIKPHPNCVFTRDEGSLGLEDCVKEGLELEVLDQHEDACSTQGN